MSASATSTCPNTSAWALTVCQRGLRSRKFAMSNFTYRKIVRTHEKFGNRAGDHLFVEPSYVVGTLSEGWHCIGRLDDPFDRALLTMFVVAEVHPFEDGNGRITRLASNRVLSQHGLARLIIPTVYRNDYLRGLRGLSTSSPPTAMSPSWSSLTGGRRTSTGPPSIPPWRTCTLPTRCCRPTTPTTASVCASHFRDVELRGFGCWYRGGSHRQ